MTAALFSAAAGGILISKTTLTATTDSTYVVPAGTIFLRVKIWGPGGGNAAFNTYGGGGGFAQADIPVTQGESLTYNTGAGGLIGTSMVGAGGGLLAFLKRSSTLLIVGGSGGGEGANNGSNNGNPGGDGGGNSGVTGGSAHSINGGGPGTQVNAGAGGTSANGNGSAGSGSTGGNGNIANILPGGNGGYGFLGGGGGGAGNLSSHFAGGGGGGGSGYFTGTNGTLTAGATGNVANSGDVDYVSGHGNGGITTAGSANPGQAGLIVIQAWG